MRLFVVVVVVVHVAPSELCRLGYDVMIIRCRLVRGRRLGNGSRSVAG